MDHDQLAAILAETIDDYRLSRKERQALDALFGELEREEDRAEVRRLAFERARATLADPGPRAVLDWLEEVVRVLHRAAPAPAAGDVAEAWFSPGDDCVRRLTRFLASARATLDVCVFTITDDRIARALLDAHGRGVAVRIVTDDEKVQDLGSDVEHLRSAGLAVVTDRSEFHMHHKSAIADGSYLLTGSFNWTRSAARDNEENFIITSAPRLVSAFARTFEALWSKLG